MDEQIDSAEGRGRVAGASCALAAHSPVVTVHLSPPPPTRQLVALSQHAVSVASAASAHRALALPLRCSGTGALAQPWPEVGEAQVLRLNEDAPRMLPSLPCPCCSKSLNARSLQRAVGN